MEGLPVPPLDDPRSYGRAFAAVYDDWYSQVSEANGPARLLERVRTGNQVVLELGIGTGRLAVPLVADGHRVLGLDASAAMLAQGKARFEEHRITVALGDMAAVPLATSSVDAVICGFNTLFNVSTVPRQRSVVAEAARVCRSGGVVAFEFVDVQLQAGTLTSPTNGGQAQVTTVADPVTRVVRGRHLVDGQERRWRIRCCSVAEVQQWAGRVGLRTEGVWANWEGDPVTTSGDRGLMFRQP